MSSPCTKRPRNEEDPHMSPDDLPSPPKRSRAQQARGKNHVSSSQANGDDDDETSTEPTSSSGSDSSEESSDEENDSENEEKGKTDGNEQETIPSITARPKPRIHRMKQNSDILSRINAFLPQMKNANENLQRELDAGRGKQIQLDHDEGYEGEGEGEGEGKEGQGYIEMNLGLGVLEEKRPGEESDDDSEDEEKGQPLMIPDIQGLPSRPKDSRVLGNLMGEKEDDSKKPAIEEMNE